MKDMITAMNQFARIPEEQGMYFSKKEYAPHPLPKYDETKRYLPSPI